MQRNRAAASGRWRRAWGGLHQSVTGQGESVII
jgi:hypothetical protein